jgi:hypothetical protein
MYINFKEKPKLYTRTIKRKFSQSNYLFYLWF